jgi:two-component system sensor histidine kinase BarA
MHKTSLKDWVIFLTVLPTTIIGITLAGYFSYSRYVELDNFLDKQASSIIEPIAIASADALSSRNREKLRHLIGFTHRSHSNLVRSIAIFTQDNQVFVSSTYHGDTNYLRLNPQQSIPDSILVEKSENFIIYRFPIIKEFDDQAVLANNQPDKQTIGYVAMQIDGSEMKYVQQQQILIALAVVVIGSIISLFFAFALIRNVTRPISTMVQAIDRIREGKLESRVSGQLIGELNFLKNGINAMAQSLGDYRDEMQKSIDQATVDLRESLEQFELQNVALDMAKRRAQEANKVKSEFLANMSHELRTPLNGVLGFTRQTLKTSLNEVQRDYLHTIERSANNLLVLINDILDFSKLDAGKMMIESIPFTLRETIEEALILLAPSANSKNIELSLRISDQIPDSLIGDAMRIRQILINLANNAIKFTDKGSVTIDVTSQRIDLDKATIKVTVKDTGIGMNKDQQKSLFDAFSQADKSVTRLYGGTGLGLVISQRLATEMHGEIGFSSETHQGSTFWFTFQSEINPLPIANPLPVGELSNKRILFFEQHDHSRIATSEILKSWHMKVTAVFSYEQLHETLEKNSLFDYALIGHDVTPAALDQLKLIITNLQNSVPVIIAAINNNAPYLQESLIQAGAKSCIAKPITPSRLCKALVPQQPIAQLPNFTDQQHKKIPIKVLAVDDNEANLKLIQALLSEHVNDVSTAINGQQAVSLCQHEKFALIFMDIQMPIMDGVTALKTIKNGSLNDDTPIIAVTAHALSDEKDQLLKDGFSDYVTKPIDEAMLRHSLYEYCDFQLFNDSGKNTELQNTANVKVSAKNEPNHNAIFNWSLALQRAANNKSLAREMFAGLINSLPETKLALEDAITSQDIELAKQLIHKLNGACCYTGVPNLAEITQQIETELKKGVSLDDLAPEWMEFFEHADAVLRHAEKLFPIIDQTD